MMLCQSQQSSPTRPIERDLEWDTSSICKQVNSSVDTFTNNIAKKDIRISHEFEGMGIAIFARMPKRRWLMGARKKKRGLRFSNSQEVRSNSDRLVARI
jgi:hypothetical protein